MNMNISIIVVDISIINGVLYFTIHFQVQLDYNFLLRCMMMKDNIFQSIIYVCSSFFLSVLEHG